MQSAASELHALQDRANSDTAEIIRLGSLVESLMQSRVSDGVTNNNTSKAITDPPSCIEERKSTAERPVPPKNAKADEDKSRALNEKLHRETQKFETLDRMIQENETKEVSR